MLCDSLHLDPSRKHLLVDECNDALITSTILLIIPVSNLCRLQRDLFQVADRRRQSLCRSETRNITQVGAMLPNFTVAHQSFKNISSWAHAEREKKCHCCVYKTAANNAIMAAAFYHSLLMVIKTKM